MAGKIRNRDRNRQHWYVTCDSVKVVGQFFLNHGLGHDVADDMVEAGLSSVTMVQRSRTCRSETLLIGEQKS